MDRPSLPILTLKQPWAGALFHGKDVENRSRLTHKRGRILIHAAKGTDPAYEQWATGRILEQLPETRLLLPEFSIRGSIIGSVEIVDCVRDHPSPWAFHDEYQYVLEEPTLYAMANWRKCVGQLGFFYRDEGRGLK